MMKFHNNKWRNRTSFIFNSLISFLKLSFVVSFVHHPGRNNNNIYYTTSSTTTKVTTTSRSSGGYGINKAIRLNLSSSSDPTTEEEAISSSFSDLGIHSSILEALSTSSRYVDWKSPTPVQQLSIPRLLEREENKSGDAFWCEAPTGSGKTAAFLIPLLQNIWINNAEKRRLRIDDEIDGRVTALVLCPTRELCVQIGSVLDGLITDVITTNRNNQRGYNRISTMTIYGGVPLEPQIARLADCIQERKTIDIVIATPGRLIDVLTSYSNSSSRTSSSSSLLSAKDAAMERKLLAALDSKNLKNGDVTLDELQKLGLDKVYDEGEDNDGSDGRSQLQHFLKGLRYLVMDESDRLLGRGFQGELDSIVDLLKSDEDDSTTATEPPTTWLFSATFPRSIEPRLDHVLSSIGSTNSPIRLVCSNSDRISSSNTEENDESSSNSLKRKNEKATVTSRASNYQRIGPASTISLRTIRLEKPDRTQALRKLLNDNNWDRVLIFVGTRYASEHVSKKLRRYGIRSSELHGKLDQDARLRRLMDLKKGKIRVLLCTDVASRGIDISGLPVVINYDLPRSTVDFVHRIGRTGRAGQVGTAISFVIPSMEAHMDLIEKRHLSNKPEREVLQGFEPDEERWKVESAASTMSLDGIQHSSKGLTHDKMFGGVKGHRKSKKDKLREAAAAKKAAEEAAASTNKQ